MKWKACVAVLATGLSLGCGGDNVLHTCDIRESSCQNDVFLAVQDVRGNVWDPWLEPPPMRVISEASYRDEVIAAHEQALRDQGVDYLTPALKLLHMIDPNEPPNAGTEFTVTKVAAYYEAASKRVTIVDHGKEAAQPLAVQTLAHELVHAAQDRDVDLGRLYQDVVSADNNNALASLLEGEAVMYALLVDAKQLGIVKGSIDWGTLSDWSSTERNDAFDKASPYRIAVMQLPYPIGGLYLSQVYNAGGPLAVRRVFDSPPLSAARYLSGPGTVGDRVMPAWGCYAPAAPPGFQLQLGDELGAFSLYALATRLTATEPDAWERAQQWTGDRFYIYTNPQAAGALVVVWVLRFQNAAFAATFQAALARMSWAGAIQSTVAGDTVRVLAANGPIDPSYGAWKQCLPL